MRTKFNLLLFIISFILFNCANNTDQKEKKDSLKGALIDNRSANTPIIIPDNILDGATPPYDLKKNSTVLENALFAWKEMIALSWKSSYTDTTIVRGQPDTNWTYASGNTKNPLV